MGTKSFLFAFVIWLASCSAPFAPTVPPEEIRQQRSIEGRLPGKDWRESQPLYGEIQHFEHRYDPSTSIRLFLNPSTDVTYAERLLASPALSTATIRENTTEILGGKSWQRVSISFPNRIMRLYIAIFEDSTLHVQLTADNESKLAIHAGSLRNYVENLSMRGEPVE